MNPKPGVPLVVLAWIGVALLVWLVVLGAWVLWR